MWLVETHLTKVGNSKWDKSNITFVKQTFLLCRNKMSYNIIWKTSALFRRCLAQKNEVNPQCYSTPCDCGTVRSRRTPRPLWDMSSEPALIQKKLVIPKIVTTGCHVNATAVTRQKNTSTYTLTTLFTSRVEEHHTHVNATASSLHCVTNR